MKNILIAALLLASSTVFAQEGEIELEVTVVPQSQVDASVKLGIACATYYTWVAMAAEQKYPNSPAIKDNFLQKGADALDVSKAWSTDTDATVDQMYSDNNARVMVADPYIIAAEFQPLADDCIDLINNGIAQ